MYSLWRIVFLVTFSSLGNKSRPSSWNENPPIWLGLVPVDPSWKSPPWASEVLFCSPFQGDWSHPGYDPFGIMGGLRCPTDHFVGSPLRIWNVSVKSSRLFWSFWPSLATLFLLPPPFWSLQWASLCSWHRLSRLDLQATLAQLLQWRPIISAWCLHNQLNAAGSKLNSLFTPEF